jgi:hypothetical protein
VDLHGIEPCLLGSSGGGAEIHDGLLNLFPGDLPGDRVSRPPGDGRRGQGRPPDDLRAGDPSGMVKLQGQGGPRVMNYTGQALQAGEESILMGADAL